jgi:hypothetical protein
MGTPAIIAIGIAIIFVTLFVVPYGVIFLVGGYRRRRTRKE